MAYIAIGVVAVWLTFLIIIVSTKLKVDSSKEGSRPYVSILIALRNEQKNVVSLCRSLNELSYTKSNYEILLGDDDSEDDTLLLLQQLKPTNARIFSFTQGEAGNFGKQKVLSKLSEEARGEFYLFTDADMTFPTDWIQGMLKYSDENQLTLGLTQVSGEHWFSVLQNLDWLFNEWIIGVFARFGINLTAWGNNMLVSKNTYERIGGHAGLKQTIVEDVDLLRKLSFSGGKLTLSTNSNTVATTKPIDDFFDLLHQRKRWMSGLSVYWPLFLIGGLTKVMFWPAAVLLILINPIWFGVIFICLFLKWMIFKKITRVTKSKISFLQLLVYEIYDFVIYLFTFAFYLLPVRVNWKGRRY